MPFYDYICRECTEGEPDDHMRTEVICSIKAISDRAHPDCPRCRRTMGRVYNQGVFGLDQQEKGIFPLPVHNLGANPVMIDSRAHLKKEMKARGRVEYDFSQAARDRYKTAKHNARRHFSMNPS